MPTGNTQQQINYGSTANDGQGDPLRTAFIKTDDNFDNVWLAGPAGSNVRITNNTIGVIDTNGNLILSPNGIGVIQTNNNLVPRLNRTYDLGSANLQYRTVYANAISVQSLTAPEFTVTELTVNTIRSDDSSFVTILDGLNVDSDIEAHGNVTADYFIGNGSQLTGLAATYGNANVVANLAALGSNPILTTGNITTTANISGGNILGNGRQLTGIVSSYGNANVVTLLSGFGSNTIATTGNVSAGNVLTSAEVIASGVIQSGTGLSTGGYLSVNGTTDLHDTNVIGTLSVNVIKSDDSTIVQIQDGLDVDGNVTADYFVGNGSQLTGLPAQYGNSNVTTLLASLGANTISGTGNITTTGNISGGFILGNISLANGFPATYGNANVANYLPTFSGNISAGNVSATGNITGAYIFGNGSQLTGVAASYGNANVVANLAALGSNPISTTGNVTAGNLIGNISITGNVVGTSANVTLVAGSYSTVFDNTGAATFPGNITTSGNISATGSILAVPTWTSAGAITFTATTTSPTKGTTTYDNISYRQLGAKQWEIILTYIQTVANGVNGSGDYLVTLPNSLSFDTTLPSQQITTTNIGTNTYALMSYIIPSGSGLINNDTLGGQVYPIVYDATKFRILTTTYGSAIQCWGSGYYSLGGDDPKIQLTFRFTST